MQEKKLKVEEGNRSIWRYQDYFAKKVSTENQLVLQEDWTALDFLSELAEDLGMKTELYLKREDQSVTGSHKFRPLTYQMALAKEEGFSAVVISTSGNAGIAASAAGKKLGIKVFVFTSPHSEKAKLQEIQRQRGVLIESNRAIRLANYLAKKYKLPNLRPSLDDNAVEGYKSLGFELYEQMGDFDAVFSFTTSGASILGMDKAFQELEKQELISKKPQIHVVQSGERVSVAEKFDIRKERSESLAGLCGVKETRRTEELVKVIQDSGGSGWIVEDEEILTVEKTLAKHQIKTSYEGMASLAAIVRASKEKDLGKVVCIFSGKKWASDDSVVKSFKAENFEEVDELYYDLVGK